MQTIEKLDRNDFGDTFGELIEVVRKLNELIESHNQLIEELKSKDK